MSKRIDDIDVAGGHMPVEKSVFWMAPEVLDADNQGYTTKSDVWSVGCVVVEMWTGQRPWIGKEALVVISQVRSIVVQFRGTFFDILQSSYGWDKDRPSLQTIFSHHLPKTSVPSALRGEDLEFCGNGAKLNMCCV